MLKISPRPKAYYRAIYFLMCGGLKVRFSSPVDCSSYLLLVDDWYPRLKLSQSRSSVDKDWNRQCLEFKQVHC